MRKLQEGASLVCQINPIPFFKWKSEQPNEFLFKQWLSEWRGKKNVKSTWERDQDSRGVGSRVHLLPQKHWKYYWNASTSEMIHAEHILSTDERH